jgi:hypothetical protein
MTAVKLSVSLETEQVRWLRAEAKRRRTSLSAVVSSAVAEERRARMREKLLVRLGGRVKIGTSELTEIHGEWGED